MTRGASIADTLDVVRARLVFVILISAAAATLVAASAASGTARLARCSSVKVSGGPYNGAGGTWLDMVVVRNTGHADCTVRGYPWVKLSRPDVTKVAHATRGMYGAAVRTVRLAPGQRAWAQIAINPGSCDRSARSERWTRGRAGWRSGRIRIGVVACKNGSGRVWVGAFHRLSR